MKTSLAIIAMAIGLMGLAFWWEASLWQECRADHSFWYCLRVLSR